MTGYEECSSEEDRGCWLINRKENKIWNITTDYDATDKVNNVPIMPSGTTRSYQISATNFPINADGLEFRAGKQFADASGVAQYPGPWIQACWGDTIIVNVTNNMKGNGTSIHWHGIRQWRSMHMDGVNGVTQCPIAPNDYFVYKFNATQYGSSWYHSHYSIQYADGLVGPLTIHGPTSAPYDIAPDEPLIMTDWSHNSAFNALSTGNWSSPSILVSGHGNASSWNSSAPKVSGFDPSKAGPYVLTFKRDPKNPKGTKKYLLRLINTSYDTTLVFTIDGHNMTVVEADFVPIHPYTTGNVTIGIGQRYNVIVESLPRPDGAQDDSDSYWIRTYLPLKCPNLANPFGDEYMKTGVLRYSKQGNVTPTPTSTPWPDVDKRPCADEPYESLRPMVEWYVGKPFNDSEAVIQPPEPSRIPENFTAAALAMNLQPPWTPFRINYSAPAFLNLNESRPWMDSEVVIPMGKLDSTDWIQLTINNMYAGVHPIHLHGHDFVILNVSDKQLPAGQQPILNYNNPPRRDVVMVPKGGFAIIAFRSDNPGSWLAHCHIARHAAEGLGLQILERREDALDIWPDDVRSPAVKEAERVCENWNKWQANCNNWGVKCDQIFQDDSGV
ncbi:multicopper oxidase-domain-containing protein [Lasiosphaeris hirsuta]|uniref:Multicopper oxidase-domain-containing protein n=1 Tax=Lasiosphaeris hirsuta TaxID=260670 RepID=A0AA40ANN4_9PEZI|nr:multicopper oxidase-domain-containing protein [Lasiosphaeris hirsuta]